MPFRPQLLGSLFMVFVYACGPDSGTPSGSSDAELAPVITAVEHLLISDVGPVEVSIRGQHLAPVSEARLVPMGGAAIPELVASGPATIVGDSLVWIPFTVATTQANGIYALYFTMTLPGGGLLRMDRPEVLRLERPEPRVDSVRRWNMNDDPHQQAVTFFGRHLSAIAWIDVTGVRSFLADELKASDGSIEADFEFPGAPPSGYHDIDLHFAGSSTAAPKVMLGMASVAFPPAPPPGSEPLGIDPFHLVLRPLRGSYFWPLTGAAFTSQSTFTVTAHSGLAVPVPLVHANAWESTPSGTANLFVDVGPDVPPGEYDLTVADLGQRFTLPAAITVESRPVVDLTTPAGQATLAATISDEAPTCIIWSEDPFGELPEPCLSYEVLTPTSGSLIYDISFAPEECTPYGGLWLSLREVWISWGFWTSCEPYSTGEFPRPADAGGSEEFAVGLHATPTTWGIAHRAEFAVTIRFVSGGN
jgi:hypothetical protein